MTSLVPPSLRATSDSALTVETVYFVIRVLRNVRRGYDHAEVSSEASPAARRLAQRAIAEIEAMEGRSVLAFGHDRLDAYIVELGVFVVERAAPDTESSARNAHRVLEEMRATATSIF